MRLLSIFFVWLIFANNTYAQENISVALLQVQDDDIVYGNADAPVTIIEYASLSCSHCATFHNTVLPKLKTTYFDAGKAKLINRHFPLNAPALKAALITSCVSKDRYYTFLNVYYELQNKWAFSTDFADKIRSIASVGGMTPDEVNSCYSNKELEKNILLSRKRAVDELNIAGTPTFFVNGKKLEVNATYENIARAIDDALAQ